MRHAGCRPGRACAPSAACGPRAPRPVRPLPSQLHQEDRDRASAAPARPCGRDVPLRLLPPLPLLRRPPRNSGVRPARGPQNRPRQPSRRPGAGGPCRPTSGPPSGRSVFRAPGRDGWSGPTGTSARTFARRRPGQGAAQRLFPPSHAGSAYPAGTSTFWPACLPDPDAMPASPAPAEGGQAPLPAQCRRVLVRRAGPACPCRGGHGLRGGPRPGAARRGASLQQLRHRGTLVWVLWDVEFLLDEPQRYAAMLAFVRRALQQISRR